MDTVTLGLIEAAVTRSGLSQEAGAGRGRKCRGAHPTAESVPSGWPVPKEREMGLGSKGRGKASWRSHWT